MRADGVDESSYAVDATRGAVDASPRRLEQQIVGDDKTTAWLKDFKENHTDTTVSFTVTALSGAKLDEAEKGPGGLLKKFKLESSMA